MILDNKNLYTARQGYNLLADKYEAWKWYAFWRANEGPIINKWLSTLKMKGSYGLDAGCGNAPYLTEYEGLNSEKILIDISEGMLSLANKRLVKYYRHKPHLKETFRIIQADILFIPLPNQMFDFILCSRVLSNIGDFRAVLMEFSRLLKPNGKLLLTDIHPSHSYTTTGIDTRDGRINIETYKHEIKDILEFAPIINLNKEAHQEFNFLDLIKKPEKKGFEKLYEKPLQPIFYCLEFNKL